MNRKIELTERFKKVAWGKLYWKPIDELSTASFDGDDVCIVKDGTATIHYKSMEAFVADLEEWEMWEEVVAEEMKND